MIWLMIGLSRVVARAESTSPPVTWSGPSTWSQCQNKCLNYSETNSLSWPARWVLSNNFQNSNEIFLTEIILLQLISATSHRQTRWSVFRISRLWWRLICSATTSSRRVWRCSSTWTSAPVTSLVSSLVSCLLSSRTSWSILTLLRCCRAGSWRMVCWLW